MYLKFALVALLALSSLVNTSNGSPDARPSPESPGAHTSSLAPAPADGVTLEEIDVVVPPVADAPGQTPTESLLEPQADRTEVVADHLVTPERVESEVVESTGFQTLGVTWPEGAEVSDLGGQVRTRSEGAWSEWIDLTPGDDAPDAGTADSVNAVRGGTDPVSIGDADAVQLSFAATTDGGPQGLRLALFGSTPSTAPDGVVGSASGGEATVRSAGYVAAAVQVASAPRVISRAEWGAPAQVCTPGVASTLVGAVVHHTAGSNSYGSVAEAMQQIRNDAAYHISGRGWCDIGYNFIVDKWGNIYEGRANSLTQAVIGVHDGGFNTGTVGVSMLGTYDGVPSAAAQQGVAQIIGWRLGAYGIDPRGTMTYYTGAGENSKFQNQNVNIARVFGHRDTAFTACPGNGGYAALPNIRNLAWDVAVNTPPINALPIGSVDSVVATNNAVTVAGWTLDPDTTASNQVHIYIDGVGVALVANLSRPDVGAVYGKGNGHGFTHTRSLAAGVHDVCVFSIDTAGGGNTLLDCRSVTVTAGAVAPRTAPIGSIDAVIASNLAIAVSGWSLDPDTSESNDVRISIDGVVAVARADLSRPDVAAVYGRGDRHGFSYVTAPIPGRHEVCVEGVNIGPGPATALGCRVVVVPDTLPIGVVDSITTTSATISVSGWTLDPDTNAPNEAHIYIDGVGVSLSANQSRPDIAAAFGRGDQHGFSRAFPAAPGSHQICVFGINTSRGANTTLTCRTVTVRDATPVGSVDSVVAGPGSLTVAGWTLDPDTTAPNEVHIYIDGVGVSLSADQSRPDVGAAFGRGDNHGFNYTARVAPGIRSMCVYGINTSQGPHTLLTCRNVVVP